MSGGILVVISTLFTVLSLLTFAVWWASFWPDYTNCIDNYEGDKSDCLTGRIEQIPPFKDAAELRDACNETDMDCISKLAEIVVTEKLQGVE